jgi:hypothetical protein
MSTEGDELAEVINRALGDVTGIFDTSDDENRELATAILAAGYRKPATVTTPDELDALPEFTVLRSARGSVWVLQRDELSWIAPPTGGLGEADGFELPATVLHVSDRKPLALEWK